MWWSPVEFLTPVVTWMWCHLTGHKQSLCPKCQFHCLAERHWNSPKVAVEKKILAKLSTIMDVFLPPDNMLSMQRSSISHRLIPRRRAEQDSRRSFVLTAIQLYNASSHNSVKNRISLRQLGGCWELLCHLWTICFSPAYLLSSTSTAFASEEGLRGCLSTNYPQIMCDCQW